MNKIKLKFNISACNHSEKDNGQPYEIRSLYECEYAENIIFKDMLLDIFSKFNINHNYNIADALHLINIFNPNLFEIEYNIIDLIPEDSIYNYYETKLKDLEKQFKISKTEFYLAIDLGIGGTVGNCRGIHFFFHTNEKDIHHIPHIHCKYGNEEFRVNIEALKPLDKTFKSNNKTKLALTIIEKNKDELIKYWNNVVINGETIKFKMYIP